MRISKCGILIDPRHAESHTATPIDSISSNWLSFTSQEAVLVSIYSRTFRIIIVKSGPIFSAPSALLQLLLTVIYGIYVYVCYFDVIGTISHYCIDVVKCAFRD